MVAGIYGSLAQLVEHWTFNPGVPGSNPGGLIKMGMVEKPFPFFFLCLVTRRGTVVL